MVIRIKTHFDAAHKLQNYKGKCGNLHGHRWEVVLDFEGKMDIDTGMIGDFSILKKIINEILPDHAYLNEVYDITEPTAERIICYLFNDVQKILKEQCPSLSLSRMELFESPECSVVLDERSEGCFQ